MQDFTHQDFDHVIESSYGRPIVVMFHASWCGPCKTMKPMMKALQAEQGFVFVGVDAGDDRALAARFNVRAVPTVLVIKDGVPVNPPVPGARTEAYMRSYLAAAGVPVKP